MADWTTLKESIANIIKANGNQEITGQVLQGALTSIINNLGENATFAGIADKDTNPGVPDGPVVYLAVTEGIYSNFGNISIELGESVFLLWKDRAWIKRVTGFATQESVTSLSSESVKSTTVRLIDTSHTQAEIEAMMESGNYDPNTLYLTFEDEEDT